MLVCQALCKVYFAESWVCVTAIPLSAVGHAMAAGTKEVMKVSYTQQRASGRATFCPFLRKWRQKFPSKCLLTYILIPLLAVPVAIDPLCNGCVVVAKEKGKMELPDTGLSRKHSFNFVYRSALRLFNSRRGGTKGVWAKKGEYCCSKIQKGFCSGAQSTVFLGFISSAAFFFFSFDFFKY